jgi:hypothetical protein
VGFAPVGLGERDEVGILSLQRRGSLEARSGGDRGRGIAHVELIQERARPTRLVPVCGVQRRPADGSARDERYPRRSDIGDEIAYWQHDGAPEPRQDLVQRGLEIVVETVLSLEGLCGCQKRVHVDGVRDVVELRGVAGK